MKYIDGKENDVSFTTISNFGLKGIVNDEKFGNFERIPEFGLAADPHIDEAGVIVFVGNNKACVGNNVFENYSRTAGTKSTYIDLR